MKINDKVNTIFLTDNCLPDFLDYPKDYYVKTMTKYNDTIELIKRYQYSFIIFEYVLDYFSLKEIKNIYSLLKKQKITFLNISNDPEAILYAKQLIIYKNHKIILNKPVSEVLKDEKLLTKQGYILPFIVNLSTQLKYYNLVDKLYVKDSKLIEDLWN